MMYHVLIRIIKVSGGKVHMPMTQKEMVKLLKQHGFVEVKSEGKGSHIKMKKPGVRSIPVPKGELKKGTERQILKQAELL